MAYLFKKNKNKSHLLSSYLIVTFCPCRFLNDRTAYVHNYVWGKKTKSREAGLKKHN